MAEEVSPSTDESNVSHDINPSPTINGFHSPSPSEQTTKVQNYFHLRSAKYDRGENLVPRSFSFAQTRINSHPPRPLMSAQSYTEQKHNSHEYSRYRTSMSCTPSRVSNSHTHPSVFPTYLHLLDSSGHQYSRYRDARSPRKTPNISCVIPHVKSRSEVYDSTTKRFPVPDEKVAWHVTFREYSPKEYTTERIQKNPKADPSDPSKINQFNQVDKKIDRKSFTGSYYVHPLTNRPQNPIGRTGITGRGRLYYWGPNHAGDPVVTRWVRDKNGEVVTRQWHEHEPLKPVLEFVAIQRSDNKQWALPGGMVDPGEQVTETIKREFQEEAVRDGIDPKYIRELFSNGCKIFESYVDDPRNTDNAWIETVAMNFHDETGELTKGFHLNAGDDAEKVVWHSVDRNLELYACHKDIIKKVVDRLHAYW